MAGCIEWHLSYGSTGYGQVRHEGTVQDIINNVTWRAPNGLERIQ